MPLDHVPRVPLAHLPTPLEPLERLTLALGGPKLFVKRDDCTGLAFGGNKTRKLEFLVAEALTRGADTLITTGGVQSNHVRQTAAAAARLGLGCELVLSRAVPWDAPDYEETGNPQLDRLLGARVHILDAGSDREAAMLELAEAVRGRGGRPYVIPLGGSNVTGALGYVACARELVAQADAIGLAVDGVVLAASSGGTQAGLLAGIQTLGRRVRVIGIDVDADPAGTRERVRALLPPLSERLGIADGVSPDEVEVEGGFAGDAYGLPTAAMAAAVTRLARLEGLLLDPVYTGKAMAGLIALIAGGAFRPSETVVFLHTGGTPALFAYRTALADRAP